MNPTLLVLTDFFTGANRALDLATRLAEPLGARLVLLHVEDAVLPGSEGKKKGVARSDDAAALALDHLTSDLPVPVVGEVGYGSIEEVVQRSVNRHQPLLIVLSRPITGSVPNELVTTTALNLMRSSTCPLLVVPPNTPQKVPQRIMLAADGHQFSLGENVVPIRDLLNTLQAQLTVAHITESATRHTTQQALQTVLHTGLTRDLPRVNTCHVCHTHAAEGILQAVAEQHADMLMMVARRHQFLHKLFHSSVTAHLVLHSPIPVLVLPAQPEPQTVARPQLRIMHKIPFYKQPCVQFYDADRK
jgi:nucleotide-binding universal stress UspA family protein